MFTATVKASTARDEAEILGLIETIHQAHYRKDGAAIAAGYTPDAVVFDLAPPLSHRGVNAEEKQAWLDTWEGPVERESRDFSITISGNTAFGQGFYRLGGNKKGVSEPISFWMRATLRLRREDNAWRIVHEHISVPFYMDGSLRPAFDLQP